jgi:hypothetical protein
MRSLILAAATSIVVTTNVAAQDCNDDITRSAGICVQQTGLNNAATCRQTAIQACNCDTTTNQCQGTGSCDAAEEAKAKINVDWVFTDKGAQTTFSLHRQMGESCFEAVVSAQAHNPPVQQLLRQCQAWSTAYLSQKPGCGGGCTLGNSVPGPQDCKCISIRPTGTDQTGSTIYTVTNSCTDGFKVAVTFIDASTNALPSTGQPLLVCPTLSYTVRAPQTYRVPSISGYSMQNGAGTYGCVCRDQLCGQ